MVSILFWVALAFLLSEVVPGDPRDGPIKQVANEIEPKILDALRTDGSTLGEAKAADLIDEAVDIVVEELAKEDVDLKNEEAVKNVVDQAVEDAISSDAQLDTLDVSPVEGTVVEQLSEEFIDLPMDIAGELNTTLGEPREQDLANQTLDKVYDSLTDEGLSLETGSQTAIEDAVSEAAADTVKDFSLPSDITEKLTKELTDAATNNIAGVDERTEDALRKASDGEIAEDFGVEVAREVANDITKEIDDIVEEVVKSGVDPEDSEAVKAIVKFQADEAIDGEATVEAVAEVVIAATTGAAAGLRAIQDRGPGAFSWFRELITNWVWRFVIVSPGPWALFTFLLEEKRRA